MSGKDKQGILPIRFEEQLQLQSLGINAASISFNTLTLESDHYICIRELASTQNNNNSNNQVVIVDLQDPQRLVRKPITADSAILNPDRKIIALKAGRQVQVFDLEAKQKLAAFSMEHEIVYWRWLGPCSIAMVTEYSVYHWLLTGIDKDKDESKSDHTQPEKQFDRHSSLSSCQIISYKTDESGQWLLLVGISAKDGRVQGSMQLYNVQKGVSQPIEGHAGAFTKLTLPPTPQHPHPTPIKLFTFAVRQASGDQANAAAKLFCIQIDADPNNPVTFSKKSMEIPFPPEAANDFPIALIPSERWNFVFCMSKFGFVHVYDLASGTLIFTNRISVETVFVCTEWRDEGGLIGVNRGGQVLGVAINEHTIIDYLLSNECGGEHKEEVAMRIASKHGLAGCDHLIASKFDMLMGSGEYEEACLLASQQPSLRTPATIQTLKSISVSPGQASPLLQYFIYILEAGGGEESESKGKKKDAGNQAPLLNMHESIELVGPILQQGKHELLCSWLDDSSKLTLSPQLAMTIQPYDPKLALTVYLQLDGDSSGCEGESVRDKVCKCMAMIGEWGKMQVYIDRESSNGEHNAWMPNYLEYIDTAIKAAITETDEKRGEQMIVKCVEYCKGLLKNGSTVNASDLFDLWCDHGLVKHGSHSIISHLMESKDRALTTRLLLAILKKDPQIANSLLSNPSIALNYDHAQVAEELETVGLWWLAAWLWMGVEEEGCVRAALQLTDADELGKFLVSSAERAASEAEDPSMIPFLVNVILALLEDGNNENNALIVKACIKIASKHSAFAPKLLQILHDDSNDKYDSLAFDYVQALVRAGKCADPSIHNAFIDLSLKSSLDIENNGSSDNPLLANLETYLKSSTAHYDAPTAWSCLCEHVQAHHTAHIPLIILAHKHGYTSELVQYLMSENMFTYLQVYCEQIDPAAIGSVIDALFEYWSKSDGVEGADCGDKIVELIDSVKTWNEAMVTTLMEILEKRERLDLGRALLASCLNHGSLGKSPAVHNALAKTKILSILKTDDDAGITTINDSESSKDLHVFLSSNKYYNAQAVGDWAASLATRMNDSKFALVATWAYARDALDGPLLLTGYKYGLYEAIIAYLLTRAQPSVWKTVFDEGNVHREAICECIPKVVVSGGVTSVQLSVLVKSLMEGGLSNKSGDRKRSNANTLLLTNTLINTLQAIMDTIDDGADNATDDNIHAHATNPSLQNLLLLQQIKHGQNMDALMENLQNLHAYNHTQIYKAATQADMWDAALFLALERTKDHPSAIKIMIKQHSDANDGGYDQAIALCERVDEPAAWCALGLSLLEINQNCRQAINALLKAGHFDVDLVSLLGERASEHDLWSSYLEWLVEARSLHKKSTSTSLTKTTLIDNQLCLCLARAGMIDDLRAFMQSPNKANVIECIDSCMAASLWTASLTIIQCNQTKTTVSRELSGREAICCLHLGDHEGAVSAAERAQSIDCWWTCLLVCLESAYGPIEGDNYGEEEGEEFVVAGVDADWKQAVDCAHKLILLSTHSTIISNNVQKNSFSSPASTPEAIMEAIQWEYLLRGQHEHLLQVFECALSKASSSSSTATTHKQQAQKSGGSSQHGLIACKLAGLYAKYAPNKLAPFIQAHSSSLQRTLSNSTRVSQALLHTLNLAHQWSAIIQLQTATGHFNEAVSTLLDHPQAHDHNLAMQASKRCTQTPKQLAMISLYAKSFPVLLGEFLMVCCGGVEVVAVVEAVRSGFKARSIGSSDGDNNSGHEDDLWWLIKEWLNSQQTASNGNNQQVNQLLCSILIQECSLVGLQSCLSKSKRIDTASLAAQLASHPLKAMHKLASSLYARSSQHKESLALLGDEDHIACISYAAVECISPDTIAVKRDILNGFAEAGMITLYLCAAIAMFPGEGRGAFAQDVVEIAWCRGWYDCVVPWILILLDPYEGGAEGLLDGKPKRRSSSTTSSLQSTLFTHNNR